MTKSTTCLMPFDCKSKISNLVWIFSCKSRPWLIVICTNILRSPQSVCLCYDMILCYSVVLVRTSTLHYSTRYDTIPYNATLSLSLHREREGYSTYGRQVLCVPLFVWQEYVHNRTYVCRVYCMIPLALTRVLSKIQNTYKNINNKNKQKIITLLVVSPKLHNVKHIQILLNISIHIRCLKQKSQYSKK